MRLRFKRYFWIIASFLVFAIPQYVFADAHGITPGDPGRIQNPLGNVNNLYEFVREALAVVRDIGILVAVFFIVYSGFLFVTARGSDEGLKKAKKVLLYTVIGTAVLLGAWLFATVMEGTVTQLKG